VDRQHEKVAHIQGHHDIERTHQASGSNVVGGKGKQSDIDARVAQIRQAIEKETSDFDKEKLQERLGKLASGVAVIRVGAATETEQKERQHRVEDAVSATKAAVEEGIVPGGGVALIRCLDALGKLMEEKGGLTKDEMVGVDIMRRAILKPLMQIADNAGVAGEVVVNEVEKKRGNVGYNAATGEYEDLVEAGIIDPAKVTRSAVQNAASAAAMLLTTEVVVAELPKKETPAMPGGGMGGGMDMGY